MLKISLVALILLVVTLLIYAATKPDTFRVQRTASINAPPDKVFGLINDFHAWASWSPWEKKDLAMKKTHSGAPQGKWAILDWDGNKDVGTQDAWKCLSPFPLLTSPSNWISSNRLRRTTKPSSP